MMIKKVVGFILSALVVAVLFTPSLAQQQRSGNFWTQLTQEQKETIKQTIQRLKQQNATREEIRTEVKKLFEDFGIQLPENVRVLFAGRRRGQRSFSNPIMDQLTAEQRTALQSKIRELRQSGKTREEIHKAVGEMLQSFGVTLPENWADLTHLSGWKRNRPGRGFRLPGSVMSQLTEEQKNQLRAKLKELREQKANSQEIRQSIKALLESYGITLPERPGGGEFWNSLTDEQKTAVKNKIKELKEAGKSPEEIHTAVGELLKSFGVKLPDDWDSRPYFGARRLLGRNTLRHLTQEQRQELKAKIQALKDQGASRTEIRKAIREFFKNNGIRPGQIGRTSPTQKGTRSPRNTTSLRARNFPNPFNPTTTIEYSLDKPAKVSVQIYNLNGQLIRTLVDEEQPAGTHFVIWNGRDAADKPVPSGLYFYRISTGTASVTQGMVLMK